MKKSMGWKVGLILAVIVFSVWMFYPPKDKINLGLDLKGGMHLILEVQTDEAIRIQTDQSVEQLKSSLKKDGIKFEKVKRVGVNKIEIIGTSFDDERMIKDILEDDFRDWRITYSSNRIIMALRPNVEMKMRDQSVDQALQTIRNRVDEFGVAEPVIQKEGLSGDRLLVQLPGVDDPARVKSLIKSTAMLEWKHVVAGPFPSNEDALEKYGGNLPDDLVILKEKGSKSFYVLRAASVVTGKDLKTARSSVDEYGAPAIGFSLNSRGARKFEKYTSKNIGQRCAIILDNRVLLAPSISTVISGDGIITGRYTSDEVNDMVLMLRSGALPAPMKYLEERTIGPSLGADSIRKGLYACMKYLEERTIGPSLGADSIRKGLYACITGLILVLIFMLVFYKGAGINSNVALILNIIILMGILSYFKATLTLPGIAGVILTIGMAVDANVLIFERIKEEIRFGKSPKSAIESGFKKAFLTIFDANLTTIIAAIFLYQFGTGPIKGFSVTLIIGIVASMFTAVFVSRVIFELTYGKRKKLKKISI
jgi:preprotein translocase subunit SecD